MLQTLPIEAVHPNPDQPRKEFDEAKLDELGASIQQRGLMQPIKVRPCATGYTIISGERRWRAHKRLNAPTIDAIVEETDDQSADEQAIIENLQRVDITPLEEAHAYKRMMDTYGYDELELAKAVGLRQPWRIQERLTLLNARPEYLQLFATGQISPKQAFYLGKLQPHNQDTLFRAIRDGRCQTRAGLRATAEALQHAEQQTMMFEDPPEVEAARPTEQEVRQASRFKVRMDQVVALLQEAIVDNEVVAVGKVNPNEATYCADLAAAMVPDLKRLELALRRAALAEPSVLL